jgi:hypothetical protein
MQTDPQFYTLKEFLKQIGMSYTAYRNNRAKGLMPPEVRVSKRTILIRKEAVDAWALSKEAPHQVETVPAECSS